FGEEENRREPEGPDGCVFVDCLDRKWVTAAAQLTDDYTIEIEKRWIAAYCEVEGTPPEWSTLDRTDLIKRFLQLCRIATSSGQDLVQLWILCLGKLPICRRVNFR